MHTDTHSPTNPMTRRLTWLPALLALLLLNACSTVLPSRDNQPVREYLLDWQPAEQGVAASGGPTLQVSAVRAAAGYASSNLLYSRQPHRLEHFARHRWADSPARMIDPLLVRAAEASGLFGAVAAPGTAIKADLRLDTRLLRLQQQVSGGDSQVVLVLRASLIDVVGGRQLASRTFEITEPAAANPYAGVQAANRAVDRLLTALTAFLAEQREAG